MKRHGCFAGAAAVVLAPFARHRRAGRKRRRRDGVEGFTHVPATTHDGQTALRLYDDVMKGKFLHRRYACAASRRNGSMVVRFAALASVA
jgi:hypothetical protein